MLWSPRNKRPERLRDMIKEMEVGAVSKLLGQISGQTVQTLNCIFFYLSYAEI